MSMLGELIKESGGAAAAFNKDTAPGTTVAGTVISAAVRAVTDIATGKPETWDDGNPKQQVVITVQTDLRDQGGDDDGARSVYVKWWGAQKQSLLQAVRSAGAADVEVGGTFAAQYVGEGEVTTKGFNPPKLYKYEYKKPSGTAGLLGKAEPSIDRHATVPAAAPAPAAPATVDPATIATVRALLAGGATDDVVRSAFPAVSAELLAALRNAA